ncbi:phosphomannomutase [Shewanella algae]|uniref:phosphomannomutase n=1 Tax=Shewanella algae TaxID=38313 RepID=UPI001AADAB53|nr:phosphomannomutase [Shewanella algae]MBO2564634.1 phosphomannomutase [Shewanella algae]MBO2611454.1 phosphomannomutase [Shewanella algae]UZD59944.1 phosphomannomutase [Shewanella algae]
MKITKDVISSSSITFGTSGARGLVSDFSAEVCVAFTLAFLSSISKANRLAIGIDNRPSSPNMARACISAAEIFGIGVDYYGVVPTPALAYKAQLDSVPAIMITGSHIPFDRNGLKFYTIAGEINKGEEQAILQAKVEVPAFQLSPLPKVNESARDSYIERYTRVFSHSLLKGKRVGVYQHSSAGRWLYPKLFKALGADVVELGFSDQFVPIDTEAVAESDRKQAREWVKQHELDILFSTDGDGDRPLLADDTGEYLRGDILGLLSAQGLGIEALAVPVSCNTAIEKSGAFRDVVRTRIGSPYVIEAFKHLSAKHDSVAGFEANGGFLLATELNIGNQILSQLATRDAILPMLGTLLLANGQPLSRLLKTLPQRFTYSDRVKDFPTESSQEIIQKGAKSPDWLVSKLGFPQDGVANIDVTDGLRIFLASGDIVHLRPSGNAPELRCYAEANDSLRAEALVNRVLSVVKELSIFE